MIFSKFPSSSDSKFSSAHVLGYTSFSVSPDFALNPIVWPEQKSGYELEGELWLSFKLQQNAETRHYFLHNIYSKNAANFALNPIVWA